MAVKSLAELCIAVCMKNIREINDVGGLPYHIVRPILMRLDSAVQLRAIEEASPHIAHDDEECWLRLIKKKYAVLHSQHDFVPRDPSGWHKVYARYAKIDANNKAEAMAKLKTALEAQKKKKEQNSSSIESHHNLPRPPRDMKNVGRKQATGRRGGSNDTGELKFTAGSRTKTNTGASVMRRVKREAAEVAARNKLATPNGALRVRQGQIKHAPKGMVHEQSVKLNPAVKIQQPITRSPEEEHRDRLLEEREARLRNLKAKGANILEDSDDDDDNEYNVFGGGGGGRGGGRLNVDELEDLFDDEDDRPPPRKPAPLPGKKGLLTNAYRGSSSSASTRPIARTTTQEPPPKPTASRQSTSTSPSFAPRSPPRPTQPPGGPSGSPDPKKLPVKRKAVDIFMKRKPKVQRR